MKPIQIRPSFKPYSKSAGIKVPLVHLGLTVQCYPTYLVIYRGQKKITSVQFKFNEAAKNFVASLDLHKGKIRVQVSVSSGTFSYELLSSQKALQLQVKRLPKSKVLLEKGNTGPHPLNRESSLELVKATPTPLAQQLELLSLGSHKKQEIEKIFERKDFRELLPLIYLLGQHVKTQSVSKSEGNFNFIHKAYAHLKKKEHDQILPALKPLLSTGFSDLLVPYLEDPFHWGYPMKPIVSQDLEDRNLLRELYELVRSCLIQKKKNALYFLPHLPPELYCGRLIQLEEEGLHIDLEWSKKTLRVLKIKATKAQTLKLHFQNHIQKCRIRVENKSQLFKNNEPFTFEASKTTIFDRFEK